MRRFGSLLLVLAMAGHTHAAQPQAQDSFYVVVFGAQRQFKQPRHSHSFATFIHLDAAGHASSFTISWLPVNGEVRPFALAPETGRNWSLSETLQLCRDNRMDVARWGPYQIDPDLWNRAVRQKEWLESGRVRYKAIDNGSKDGIVSNCLHAIAFMAREPGQSVPFVFVAPANWGESGSYWIALTFRPWYIEPCQVHHDLLCRIGQNPGEFKDWRLDRNPTRNPATRMLQGLIHNYLLENRVHCP